MRNIVDKIQEGFFDNINAGETANIEKRFNDIMDKLIKKYPNNYFKRIRPIPDVIDFLDGLPAGYTLRIYNKNTTQDYVMDITGKGNITHYANGIKNTVAPTKFMAKYLCDMFFSIYYNYGRPTVKVIKPRN